MNFEEQRKNLIQAIQGVSARDFEEVALRLFRFQAQHCRVYNQFLDQLRCIPSKIRSIDQIPFLPIETFKYNVVQTGTWEAETCFKSSGTVRSQHWVRSLAWYHRGTIETFEQRFGSLRGSNVLALLPHYIEAGDSSLVSMVTAFMQRTGQDQELFFLHDFEGLAKTIDELAQRDQRIILFGVTYALLDFAASYPIRMPKDILIMETGGMKGRKKEWLRTDLHQYLCEKWQIHQICTEYGMTELYSQAYGHQDGWLRPARHLKILIKELTDPMIALPEGKTGVIHAVDLANIDTCAFIATSDIGRENHTNGFQVLGRMSDSDMRGCQLLYLSNP